MQELIVLTVGTSLADELSGEEPVAFESLTLGILPDAIYENHTVQASEHLPIKLEDLKEYIKDKKARQNDGFIMEFEVQISPSLRAINTNSFRDIRNVFL